MGDGVLADSTLQRIERAIEVVGGDLAEIGVGGGGLFRRLIELSGRRGCLAHGFDSFAGMDEPGEFDSAAYWRGRFDAGGARAFAAALPTDGPFQLHAGYVPDCFAGFGRPLALAYVDLDHYLPTRRAIEAIAPLIVAGGVLAFDDYFPDDAGTGASRAIAEALAGQGGMAKDFEPMGGFENNQLLLRRKAI